MGQQRNILYAYANAHHIIMQMHLTFLSFFNFFLLNTPWHYVSPSQGCMYMLALNRYVLPSSKCSFFYFSLLGPLEVNGLSQLLLIACFQARARSYTWLPDLLSLTLTLTYSPKSVQGLAQVIWNHSHLKVHIFMYEDAWYAYDYATYLIFNIIPIVVQA